MKDTMQDLREDPVYAAQLNNLIARSTGVNIRYADCGICCITWLKKSVSIKSQMQSSTQYKWKLLHIMALTCKDGFCGNDDPFMPTYLEQLIIALGGTPVNYDLKCQSVGAPSLLL